MTLSFYHLQPKLLENSLDFTTSSVRNCHAKLVLTLYAYHRHLLMQITVRPILQHALYYYKPHVVFGL